MAYETLSSFERCSVWGWGCAARSPMEGDRHQCKQLAEVSRFELLVMKLVSSAGTKLV